MSDAWTYEFTRNALRDLRRLPRSDAERVYQHLDRLIQGGAGPDSRRLVPLRGQTGVARLRVGDWRVIIVIDHDDEIVIVTKVAHRRDVYR